MDDASVTQVIVLHNTGVWKAVNTAVLLGK